MPAAPAAVADRAAAGVRTSTLGRRVAAIAYAHDLAGKASPTAAKLVLAVLDGARRVKGAKPAQKAPATAERAQSVALIVKQRVQAAGLDPREFADHSLRRVS